MTWAPDVTVAAVVEHNGQFLMVEEQVSTRAVFNQPAGHLEDGESPIEGVIRETREETGWLFEPAAVTGVYLWRNPDNSSSFLRLAFFGTCCDHDPNQPLDAGILGIHWLSLDQVIAHRGRLRSPMVLRCIEDHLAGKRHPLELISTLTPEIIADCSIHL